METQEYTPVINCLALTVRKEHRLTVIKKTAKTTIRMSVKTLFYLLFLMFANIMVYNLIKLNIYNKGGFFPPLLLFIFSILLPSTLFHFYFVNAVATLSILG